MKTWAPVRIAIGCTTNGTCEITTRMTSAAFHTLALSFPFAEASPRFEKIAFKIKGRKIFATLDEVKAVAVVKLSPVDQSVFCDFGKDSVYPVPNKWGTQGWTTFELKNLSKEFLHDALSTAYQQTVEGNKSKK